MTAASKPQRVTAAYLRSLPDTSLTRLRAQYETLAAQADSPAHDARGPSRTWRNRIAAIMAEQGRRWGRA